MPRFSQVVRLVGNKMIWDRLREVVTFESCFLGSYHFAKKMLDIFWNWTVLPPFKFSWILSFLISVCTISFAFFQQKDLHTDHMCCSVSFRLSACDWMWDNLTCWQAANVGEVVEVNCPELLHDYTVPEDGEWQHHIRIVLFEHQVSFHSAQFYSGIFFYLQKWGRSVVTVLSMDGQSLFLTMRKSVSSMTTLPNL